MSIYNLSERDNLLTHRNKHKINNDIEMNPINNDVSKSINNIVQILKEKPPEKEERRIAAHEICFNNPDIMTEIASFLLSPSLSYISKSFAKVNQTLRIRDIELAILLDKKNVLEYVQLAEISKARQDLEKTLKWLMPQRLAAYQNNQSKVGLISYTKRLLKEISVSTIPSEPCRLIALREFEDRRGICGTVLLPIMVVVLISGLTLYEALKNPNQGTSTNINTKLFTATICVSLFILFIIYEGRLTDRREKEFYKKKNIYNEELTSYLEKIKKCARILQHRAQIELNLPDMADISQIPDLFSNTYKNNPTTIFGGQASYSHADISYTECD